MHHTHDYQLIAAPLQLLGRYDRWRSQAQLCNLSSKACLRLEWIIFYYTAGNRNATVIARHFGIARSKFYYWFSRFDERALKSLEDKQPIPNKTPAWAPDPLALHRMISLRKQHLKWSKLKLAAVYEVIYGEPISSWQFQRVIQKFQLYPPKKSRKCAGNGAKRQRITNAIRQLASNLFQLDTIVLHLFGQKRYVLTAVGHTGKLAYARLYSSHASLAATDFLQRLIYLLEGQVTVILTDNGSEFQKHFAKSCYQLGIGRYYTKPRTPKDNPECERFNRTLQEEWLDQGNWYERIHDMNLSLTNWLIEYNSVRPHQTLKYQTPLAYSVTKGLLSKRSSSSTLPIFGKPLMIKRLV